jgi:predicted Zn-dependent protease
MLRNIARATLLVAFCSVAFGALKHYKLGWNLFSIPQDIQIGKQAALEVDRQYELVDDDEVQSYIAGIGRELAAQPEAGKFPYSFKVVNDDSINAFALPGGPVYVQTGLILAAENEAQLAGVLAHEMSHCALRHGTHQASQAKIAKIAGGVLGGGSILTQAGIGLGLNSALLTFSRAAESEADLNGAQMMAAAGYNPIEMARFFEKLEGVASGKKVLPFLSSHPNPGNRMRAIEHQLREMPVREYTADTGKFQTIQARVSRIPAPSSPIAKRDP